jgi:hypothetical protein
VARSDPPMLLSRDSFEDWKIDFEDWIRRNGMWEAVFDPKPDNRKSASRRDEAFARNELYLKYDLEIRTMLAMTSGLTFKIFTDGILKRCEEIKFEEESNIGTSNQAEAPRPPPVEEVNIANDRNHPRRPYYNDRDNRGRPHYGGRHSSYSGRSFRGRTYNNRNHPSPQQHHHHQPTQSWRNSDRDTFNSNRARGSGRSYGHREGRSNHRVGRSNQRGGQTNYYGNSNKRNYDEAFNAEKEVVETKLLSLTLAVLRI